MFNKEQIEAAEEKVQTGIDFPNFAAELKAMGVTRADVFAINGITIYYGVGDEAVEGTSAYETLLIEPESSLADFQDALKNHQAGIIDYQTFCKQAALAGVEKWIIDLKAMNVTYLDSSGNELIIENIAV